jgi:serine/threonine protein phosphatase PrpC
MRLKQNCNILIYNNNEKKEILSHCKNSKTISSFKEFINFKMITNPKDVSEENNTIKRNESQKDHMSRNKKKCKILTNTNSINIENNNTNYVSPKQHEKEECTTNYINTPLLYNNMILMTMNNKKKVDNKTNFHNYKKRRINYNLTNKIKNKQKKKINHEKRLSIPNISSKNNITSDKKECFEKPSGQMNQTQAIKDNLYFKKITLKNNIPKIPIIKKIVKIDSCSVRGYSAPDTPKINQDNYFIIKDFLNNTDHFLIGLCDGHGSYGHLISKYICDILPKKMTKLSDDIISEVILSTNKSLIEESKIDCSLSGSTCTTLLIYPERIISANVGDTRAVIAQYENGQYNARDLTRDHKPKELDEMKRIINSDGRIKQYTDPRSGKAIGPQKIWLKNSEIPGLSISRSLGDNLAHTIGVISEPEINTYEFKGNEKFILLASEGIWKYIDSDESVKIIKDFYEKNLDAVGAINTLVKEAFKRWKNEEDTMDDITAILIFFE